MFAIQTEMCVVLDHIDSWTDEELEEYYQEFMYEQEKRELFLDQENQTI